MEFQHSYNFDWALIFYALTPQRVLFIDKPNCWIDFHSANQGNRDKYYEYTPHQLCEHFLTRVLVQIENYDLNDKEKHLLKLLEIHPYFRRTEVGFTAVREQEMIDFSQGANKAFNVTSNSSEGFLMNTSDLNCQIVLTPNDGDSHSEQRSNHQLSEESAALFSVCLSSGKDLPKFERLTEAEIKRRLREAKRMFQQKGHQMENTNISIDGILGKLKKLREVKQAIICLVKENF